jgi:glycosyltransferase involved in cell wall biosynthesis
MDALTENIMIALPTLNEEKAIEGMVNGIRSCVDLPITVIDGYSKDQTVQIAKGLGVDVFIRSAGTGYGCAIQKALEVAAERKFDWLLIMDCDMTYLPSDITKLTSNTNGADLIIGVRPMHRISPSHRLANRLHSNLARLLFNHPVRDINSGMRMIKVNKFRNRLTEKNMGMVAQISAIAMRNDWSIKEVSIEYGKRVGQSKIDVFDWFVITWCIVRERFNSHLR